MHLVCLYYIGAGEIDSERIRAEMARYLPYYMIPAAFVRMDVFPKTRTGKIDRKALPAPDLRSDVAIVPPSTDFEKMTFPIVAAELGTEDFGVLTNLVSLGLTSLRAIRLSAALVKATGRTVSVSDMLSHPRLCDWEAFAAEATQRLAGLAANAATVPLSANQLGLYIDWTKAPHGLQYNLPFALRFDGVSGEALREAVGKVVKAHPVLTAHIENREGSIVLVRRDGVELPISFETLDREPDAAFFQSRVRPFDLLKDDLARFEVYVTPQAPYLFLDVHHIVFDGGSMNVLLKDVVACLKGGEPAAEQASSFDVAVYGQDWLASTEARSSEAYFDNLVAGTESFLYPSARNGAASSGKAETKSVRVPLAPIQAKCRELGVTENAFFATALCEVFRRVSRIDDIQIATVSNGRSLAQLQNTVGMFVQTLPLVSRKAKGPAVEAICAMQDEIVETLRNDRYPFAKLVERHGLKPNVLYAYQGDVIETENLSDARAIPLSLDTAKVPLTLNVTPKGDAYDLVFEYDAGLYGADEIETLAQAFAGLTASLAALPDDASLAQATLVDEASARDLLALGTGEKLPYDRSETFVDQFLRSVAAWPDATAVVAANGTLTYRELDERSDTLAAKLVAQGVKCEEFVAIKMGRVKEFLVAVLGIWKAGGAYLPLGAEYPEERIRFMLEDSEATVIVDEAFLEKVEKIGGGGQWNDSSTFNLQPSTFNLAKPSGLAYMIYTSGSTGKPKGTMLEHVNLRAFNEWLVRSGEIGFGDAIAVHSSFSFDGSCLDLYPALTVGGTVHILSKEVREDMMALDAYFRANRIKGGFLTARLAGEMLANFDLSLHYLMAGGEKVVPFKPTKVRVMNAYGPTECTILSTCGLIDQTFPSDNLPLGRPVPNTFAAIVDTAGNLLPRGMAGELCLCGPQIARGYWKRQELTAEKFLPSPFYPGERMYRTGDICTWNDRDELVCLGRIDKQVKLRGFRIELGEIEAVLAKCAGVTNEAVEIREINGTQHLVAYYVSESELDAEALKGELSKTLTSCMVPEVFVRIETMPLTPNGKVDRKALPEPEIKAGEIVAPETDGEKALFAVVAAELKTEQFGVTTNLISMGLTSIRAIRLSAAIKKATGLVVSTGDILAKPRIRDWASLGAAETETIAVLPPQETYPLTANQLGVYLDWVRNRAGLQYNVPLVLRFADLDAMKLREAVAKAVATHPYFKVHLEDRYGTVVQVRRDKEALDVLFEKLNREPDAAFFQSRVRPFDLLRDDLARFEIYVAPKAAYMFGDVHHILFDGGAVDVFLSAVRCALAGGEPSAEQASAYDYALHDAVWQSSKAAAKAAAHFDGLVAGTESFLYPPLRGDAVATGKSATCSEYVPLAAIRGKCRELGVTENAFFATALCEVFRRVSRIDDIQIATVSNGRSLAQLQNTVGMFVQTLPLVSRKAKGTAVEAIRAMQDQIAMTLANDRYPFAKLVERHGLKPNVLYVYQGDVVEFADDAAVTNLPLALDTVKFPLSLDVTPKGEDYEIAFEYDAGLYGEDEIRMLAKGIASFAGNIAAAPVESSLSSVPLVGADDAAALIALGSGEKLDYDRTETLVDLFLRKAQENLASAAIVAANGTLTYAELDALSDALAAALVAKGVKRDDFVAVKLGRVKEFPLAILAIWKAGAAYVPVDPEYPEDRIRFMIEDSGARVVVDETFLEEVKVKGEGEQWNDSSLSTSTCSLNLPPLNLQPQPPPPQPPTSTSPGPRAWRT